MTHIMIKTLDEAVKYRRSVRIYTDQKINSEDIRECIKLARLAPSSSNMQLWEFHHVSSPEMMDKLRPICMNQNAIKYAQQAMVMTVRRDLVGKRAKFNIAGLYKAYGKKKGDELTKREKGNIDYYGKLMPFVYKDFLGIIGLIKILITQVGGLFRPSYRQVSASDMKSVGHKSCALAAQTFMLACAARNIDTCPMEGIDTLKVKRLLGLPRRAEINMVITLGYRAEGGIYRDRILVPFEEMYKEY